MNKKIINLLLITKKDLMEAIKWIITSILTNIFLKYYTWLKYWIKKNINFYEILRPSKLHYYEQVWKILYSIELLIKKNQNGGLTISNEYFDLAILLACTKVGICTTNNFFKI